MFIFEKQINDFITNLSESIVTTLAEKKLEWQGFAEENNFSSSNAGLSSISFFVRTDNYVGKTSDFISNIAFERLKDKLSVLPDTKPLLEYVPGHDFGNDIVYLTVEASLNNESNPWDQNTIFVRYELQIFQSEEAQKNSSPYFSKDGLLAAIRNENTFDETVDNVTKGLSNVLQNMNRDFWDSVSTFPRFADTDVYLERYPESFTKIDF